MSTRRTARRGSSSTSAATRARASAGRTYEAGSGTETLTFAWTAAAADESAAGVAVLADTLELNGGTIVSAATQADVALGHPGRDADPAHKVDAVAPELLRGEIDGGTVTLWFSEALDPGSTGGVFKVKVLVSKTSAWIIRAKGPVTIDGETATVELGAGNPRTQEDLKGNLLEYLRRADGTDGPLRDLAGNPVLTPHTPRGIGIGTNAAGLRYVSIDLENVTGKTAAVTGAEVVTDAGSDGAFAVGATVEAEVTFDAPVTVGTEDGAPTLALIANGGIRLASYASGTGTETLTFAWRVGEADGPVAAPVRVAASGLKLNGGTIASAAGRAGVARLRRGPRRDGAVGRDAGRRALGGGRHGRGGAHLRRAGDGRGRALGGAGAGGRDPARGVRRRLGDGRAGLPLHARPGRRAVGPRGACGQQPQPRRRVDRERGRRARRGARARRRVGRRGGGPAGGDRRHGGLGRGQRRHLRARRADPGAGRVQTRRWR